MRIVQSIPRACDRAREWCSFEVDGELSSFEQALLEAHVSRCPDCRAFRIGVAGATALVQATPLDRPSEPIRIPSGRRSRFVVQRVLAPAAVAAVVAVAAITANARLFGVTQPARPSVRPSGRPSSVLRTNADLAVQRRERRAQLVELVHFPSEGPGGPQLSG
jgi:Putative zinc-finger